VAGPPAAGAYRERPSKPTSFRKSYERRELPVALLHDTRGQQIAWKLKAGYSEGIVLCHEVKDETQ
ncbi:unnamed protein product, partial [Tetraodon nigroviridis]